MATIIRNPRFQIPSQEGRRWSELYETERTVYMEYYAYIHNNIRVMPGNNDIIPEWTTQPSQLALSLVSSGVNGPGGQITDGQWNAMMDWLNDEETDDPESDEESVTSTEISLSDISDSDEESISDSDEESISDSDEEVEEGEVDGEYTWDDWGQENNGLYWGQQAASLSQHQLEIQAMDETITPDIAW